MLYSIDIESLRDNDVVVMPPSIDIESLRDIDVVVVLPSIDIESLRDNDVVVVLPSIDIESLRDNDVVVVLPSIDIESLRDIIFPVRGININRIRGILHFQIILAEGLILICTRKMYGMRKREDHLIKCKTKRNNSVIFHLTCCEFLKKSVLLHTEINTPSK